ncbi:hypothetical protein DICSQDRAFT_143244 [Dichomitus squalens LYAD-421 SS1]|uniref:uncharacterized protein n=1 Tax=Dichomitus squalens (strain LYAD-421) TaxID=732165 RepID=UPI00044158D5|nr:uncharacterized protein DICSQDRAFT_143244 [Dichomitus squalens LYAD-421 SS1]EJF65881.1 hypothetical protein DICSQDRAFT_143244 [Dichomitus squalens LYAD-421 SS1]
MLIAHGVPNHIGVFNLIPPECFCLRKECAHAGKPRPLGRRKSTNVVYCSREHGPVPAVSYSARCPRCHDRYYHNYYVDQAKKMRVYYGGTPSVVHVNTHLFLETSVCDRFRSATAAAWVSFTNNARIYNHEHRTAIERFPSGWSAEGPKLTAISVGDAFFLHALLHEQQERALPLVLPNIGDQSARLDPALVARTASFVGPGRPMWNHICDRCCAIKKENDKAVVMDGISIGRPCCNVHDCQEPLPSQRARFCSKHAYQNHICVVIDCTAQASHGFQTCPDPAHRELEDPSRRSALFVLRRRLERLHMSSVEDDGVGTSAELTEVDVDGECPSKSDEGNIKPRARFGRRRTHNEQLIVATCGIILARATMFGSEGVDGARKHIMNIPDPYFDHVAMPVDPFHAKTKHKDSDAFCGQYCNAALFPDLLVGNQWRFNSSAAEMTNAWFGGFQAMVREMRATRYDFLLDERIGGQRELQQGAFILEVVPREARDCRAVLEVQDVESATIEMGSRAGEAG